MQCSIDLRMSKLRFAVEEGEKDIVSHPGSERMRKSVFSNIRVRVEELEAAIEAARKETAHAAQAQADDLAGAGTGRGQPV